MTALDALLPLFGVLLICTPALASDDIYHDLINQIQSLSEKVNTLKETHTTEIQGLKARVLALERKNAQLSKENVEILRQMEQACANIVSEEPGEGPGDEGEKSTQLDVLHGNLPKPFRRKIRTQRGAQDSLKVAFTAYLDHDMNNIGAGQTVVFNQILLNDGNGYNKHSGMFTAPIFGVYSFTFFVGQRDRGALWAGLFVNSVNKVDAGADGTTAGADTTGGNAADLKLNAGDVVYVKNFDQGDHIEGRPDFRTTSFSGHLVYQLETPDIVGNKIHGYTMNVSVIVLLKEDILKPSSHGMVHE